MPRGTRKYPGEEQLIISEFLPDTSLPVYQPYELINGRQSLQINSAKLVRASIMQLERGDTGFKPYIITVQKIAEMLNISKSNVYRDIEKIVDDIIKNPVEVKQIDGKKDKWIKYPWVSRCEYNSDVGLLIRLNDDLAPLLLNMQQFMSNYTFKEIANMRSINSIRIYELIKSRISTEPTHSTSLTAVLSVNEIREACNCENVYLEFSNLKLRVIDPAIAEINHNTSYDVNYTFLKSGRKVAALEFEISLKEMEF